MDFSLTDEQRMLQDTAARMIREQYGFEARQKRLESEQGYSPEMWQQYGELGLLGVPFAMENGGFGGGGAELMLVAQEFGKGLVLEPYLATVVLAGGLIEAAGNDRQKERYLAPLIGGELLASFAHGEPQSRYEIHRVETRAEQEGQEYRINGRKAVVLHGDSADLLVVSARVSGEVGDRDGIALFLVDADAAGVERRGYPTIDGLRAAEVVLDNVKVPAAACLGEPGKAADHIDKAMAQGIVALCAEAVGAMEMACDLTLDYLKQRTQFGVPIGKFQALQHRMVDMRIELEQARSMAILAASKLDAEAAEREPVMSAAKALIGRAGRQIAEEAIQLHGGIGMSWEYSLPHYCKRLVMIDHQLGDLDYHLERFGGMMESA